MAMYWVRRIIYLIITTLVLLTLVFFVLRVLPSNPAYVILGDDATAETVRQLEIRLGLDRPLTIQYKDYMLSFLRGDLGSSLRNNLPIRDMILKALPYTIELTIAGILVGVIIGLPLGIVAALRRNGTFDFVSRVVTLALVSAPPFFLGVLLLIVFSLKLRWFPITGAGDPANLLERLRYLLLPALAIGLPKAGVVLRFTRSCMLDVIKEDYVRTARSKGLSELVVIYKHALKNALIPITTVIGNYIGRLLGGAVLVEIVFTRPGMGRLMIQAIEARDYPMVQATIVCFCLFVALVNLLVDITYATIDPRIRYE